MSPKFPGDSANFGTDDLNSASSETPVKAQTGTTGISSPWTLINNVFFYKYKDIRFFSIAHD